MGLELLRFHYLTFVHQLESTPNHSKLLAVGIMGACFGLLAVLWKEICTLQVRTCLLVK